MLSICPFVSRKTSSGKGMMLSWTPNDLIMRSSASTSFSLLTKRQMESMAESFAGQELVSDNEKEELIRLSFDYLDVAIERGLDPMMSYRGRAAGVMLRAVRDLGLQVSRMDIARAAGFDKGSMGVNANAIESLLKDLKSSESNGS